MWRTLWRWIARVVFGLAALAIVAVFAIWLFVHESRPTGEAGPAADALARKIQAAVDVAAWRRVGAIRWCFAGRHHLLWDRRRGLVQVRWKERLVRYRLADRRGLVWRGGRPARGVARAERIAEAHRIFINDSFWLQPFSKLFDPGVKRALVGDALLVSFGSGGVTPGDAYLISADSAFRPTRWKMWVRIIPIGGISATWEGWQRLPGGALVATKHASLLTLRLSEIRAASTAAELNAGDDPFTNLLRELPARVARPPASQPSPPTTRPMSQPG